MEKVTVHLTREERQVIYSMTGAGRKDSEIAKVLGRHRSTIGRERGRKKPRATIWNAMTALERASYMHEQAIGNRTTWKRGARRGQERGPVQEKLRHLIEDGRRSAEQAAAILAQSDEPVKMSGKTIRRYVDKEAPELKKFFPLQGRKRQKREVKTDNGMRSYDELPFAAATRARMGDLEVDLIVCSQSTESILSVSALVAVCFCEKSQIERRRLFGRSCFGSSERSPKSSGIQLSSTGTRRFQIWRHLGNTTTSSTMPVTHIVPGKRVLSKM